MTFVIAYPSHQIGELLLGSVSHPLFAPTNLDIRLHGRDVPLTQSCGYESRPVCTSLHRREVIVHRQGEEMPRVFRDVLLKFIDKAI
jgi:hypothetical protein